MATWAEQTPWAKRWWTTIMAGCVLVALTGMACIVDADVMQRGAGAMSPILRGMLIGSFALTAIGFIGLFIRGMIERMWPTPPQW